MTEENIRGDVRKKPDPMALATKGRITTYESLTLSGVATQLRTRNNQVKLRTRGGRISLRR